MFDRIARFTTIYQLAFLAFATFFGFYILGSATNSIEMLQAFNLDEGAGTWQLVQNIQNRDFDPRGFYNYGYLYINLTHWLVKPIGWMGIDTSGEQLPAVMLRLVSTLSWAGSGWLLYALLRSFGTRVWLALGAVMLMLGSYKIHYYATMVHPDLLQMILVVAALYFSRKALFNPRWILATGLTLGLAFGTKYSGAFLLPIPFLLIFYLLWNKGLLRILAYVLGVSALFLMGWLLTNHYVIGDWDLFLEDLQYESEHVGRGHWRAESGNPLGWFWVFMNQFHWTANFLSGLVVGTALMLVIRERKNGWTTWFTANKDRVWIAILLFTFLLGMGYLMLEVNMRRPRYMFHLLPIAVVFSIYFIQRYESMADRGRRWVIWAIMVIVPTATLLISLTRASSYLDRMQHPHITTGMWIRENYPADLKILSDYYSYLPPDYFTNSYHTFGVTKEEIEGHQPGLVVINKQLSGARSWKAGGTAFSEGRFEVSDFDGAAELGDFHRWLFSEESGWEVVYELEEIVVLEKRKSTD